MAKKSSRDLFKQMNSNVSNLEETDKSPILNTETKSDMKTEYHTSQNGQEAVEDKSNNVKIKKVEEKKDNTLVRITYNLTYDLNEKFNSFTERYELYKTSLIKALMEGWLDGTIELDENEVLFNDGLIKIKKKAGSRKVVGSILISAELDDAFTKKCREAEIEKNNCIFRLLKKYLEQKIPEDK